MVFFHHDIIDGPQCTSRKIFSTQLCTLLQLFHPRKLIIGKRSLSSQFCQRPLRYWKGGKSILTWTKIRHCLSSSSRMIRAVQYCAVLLLQLSANLCCTVSFSLPAPEVQLREYQKDLEYRLHHRLSKFDRSVFLNLKLISYFSGVYMAWVFIQKLLELVRS